MIVVCVPVSSNLSPSERTDYVQGCESRGHNLGAVVMEANFGRIGSYMFSTEIRFVEERVRLEMSRVYF